MVFELFDKDLMNSFSAAQDERQLLGRNYLSSDVLLLDLLKVDCLASKSLQYRGLTFESVAPSSFRNRKCSRLLWKDL
jgi:hypothetical protein